MDFDVNIIQRDGIYTVAVSTHAHGVCGIGSDVDVADAFAIATIDWEKQNGVSLDSQVTK